MKKLIGLTGPSAFSDDCKKLIEKYLKQNYVTLCHEDEENSQHWLGKCDAFVVAGGVDVHPTVYGRNVLNGHNLSKFDLQRDLRELSVLEHALTNKKPTLAICRGHQLMGVVHGFNSDFCMDLSNCSVVHQPSKSGVSINKGEPAHVLELISHFEMKDLRERAVLERVMGESRTNMFWVNSYHHQGIAFNPKLPYSDRGVYLLGLSPAEFHRNSFKIIELMKGESWISCQWHPEWDYEVNTPSRGVVDHFNEMLRKL